MTKKAKKAYHCDPEFKDLEINIEDLDVDFDVDPEVITEDQCCHITKILEEMSRSIWIDKTYVDFKGNHFKDAFIVESEWYKLLEAIREQLSGKKLSKKKIDYIRGSLMTVAMFYLYGILDKYGYDPNYINIYVDETCENFHARYFKDTRTSWEM